MGKRLASVVSRFVGLCKKRGIEPQKLHSNEWGDVLYAVMNPEADIRVCFVAGIHGDEMGGPQAILRFLEQSEPPENVGCVLLPVWNPEGLEKNLRRAGRKDPNRQWCHETLDEGQRKLVKLVSGCHFLHTLHEDPDRKEFYFYFADESKRNIFKKLIDLVAEAMPITKQKTLYQDPVDNGMIYRPKLERGKHDCSVETFFMRRGIPYLTTETPGQSSLELRGEVGRMTMEWLLQNLEKILS